MNLPFIDTKYLAQDEDTEDLRVVRSEDNFLYDEKGKKYIDFNMGWCVGNFGWGRENIREKMNSSPHPDYVFPHYKYQRWEKLAELLARISPTEELHKSYRTTGGTEAVEAAMQISMMYTGRSKFISLEGCYHGNSIATLSLNKEDNKDKYENLLTGCSQLATPLDEKAADKLETQLKKKDVAAFIMEPISCNLGVLVPQSEFMERAQQLCNKYGTLLVMDEVACGFGRTGKIFATEHYDIQPDILCVAKAISGGAAGLGATITTEKISHTVNKKSFTFYSTYGWHPASVEAAIANIRFIIKNKNSLLDHIEYISQYFYGRLRKVKFNKSAIIRIKGLAIGIDVESKKYANKLVERCREGGLLFTSEEETLLFFPALTITENIAKRGLDILEKNL
ncbi:MAG: aspartate aminotransferase family protein [Bacteroidota bacterium]|nr:aspartate aminotransferase family protein [Bacteroidota bacterium]